MTPEEQKRIEEIARTRKGILRGADKYTGNYALLNLVGLVDTREDFGCIFGERQEGRITNGS
jgi:hypothetical protein